MTAGHILSFLIFMWPATALAHSPGQSSVELKTETAEIRGDFKIFVKDLPPSVVRDSNIQNSLQEFLQNNLIFKLDGQTTPWTAGPISIFGERKEMTLLVPITISLPAQSLHSLEMEQNGFFEANPQFTSLIILSLGKDIKSTILTRENNKVQIFIDAWTEFWNFLKYGIEHIMIGLDHIFFVVLLVLGAFLIPSSSRPVWNVFKLVTAFTLAHSTALCLSVTDVLSVPSKPVEIMIAASIAFVGLHNIFRFDIRNEWIIVFFFGLFHGLGFSGGLRQLGLNQGSLAVPLTGFNLGVELGQIMIITVLIPAVYLAMKHWKAAPLLLRGTCGLITLMAFIWLWERAVGS